MQSKKFNILFISSWYPNKFNPLLGVFIKRHAETIALLNNVAVIYICSDKTLKKEKFILEEKIENNVSTITIYYRKVENSIPLYSHLKKSFLVLKYHFLALSIVKKKYFSPNIVHANVIFPIGIIALFFKIRFRLNYLVTEHSTEYLASDGRYKGAFRKLVTKLIVRNSKAITPVSIDLEKALKAHNLRTFFSVIPNVVDGQLFYPNYHHLKHNKIRIIHVSGLDEEQKNISGILRTINKISHSLNNFELIIVGESINRKELEQYSEQLNILNKYVFFVGRKMNNELAEIIRSSDFFILFSNYENSPCVLIEAISSGIPVISTNVGGVAEYINNKTGILIEAKNEIALAESIEWMIKNYHTFNKNKLHEFAQLNFGSEAVANKFNDLYKYILN